MLDTDLSWTTDLRWSTGPSWTTFSTIFGLFPGGPRSVPRTFFINGKVFQIGSRGVFDNFFSIFFGGVQEGPPINSPASRIVFRDFWKKWVGGQDGVRGSGGLPKEDSYTNSRSTARLAAATGHPEAFNSPMLLPMDI